MNARNPISLVRAFKRFLDEIPDAGDHSQLLFLGKESKYTEEFRMVKQELPQFYSSDSYIPFQTVLAIQKEAAVNVILEAKGAISPFLPGKFPHCIQAEKPIFLLGSYYSECRRLLGKEYPWWSEIDDEERILGHLHKLYSIWKTEEGDAKIDYQSLKQTLYYFYH